MSEKKTIIQTDGVYPEHQGYIVRDLSPSQVIETLEWKRPVVLDNVDIPAWVYTSYENVEKWLLRAFLNKGYVMVEPPDENGRALAIYHHDGEFHLARVLHKGRFAI